MHKKNTFIAIRLILFNQLALAVFSVWLTFRTGIVDQSIAYYFLVIVLCLGSGIVVWDSTQNKHGRIFRR